MQITKRWLCPGAIALAAASLLLFAVIPKIGPQPEDVCATALRHARA